MPERPLLDGFMRERPSEDGFDELLGGPAEVHLEMMDAGTLWGAFYRPGTNDRVVIWIRAKKGKLEVAVHDDM